MKIDFHTHYQSPAQLRAMCKRAKALGLDGLVMEGIDFLDKPTTIKDKDTGILVFPAQEVNWKTAISLSTYKNPEKWYEEEPTGFQTKTYTGKALVLLPSDIPFPQNFDPDLLELLDQVSTRGGATISLHNNSSQSIPLTIRNYKTVFPFDAIRMKPYNILDGQFTTIKNRFRYKKAYNTITGSNASSPEELSPRGGFTRYALNHIDSTEQLISTIKNQTKHRNYIHTQTTPTRLETPLPRGEVIISRQSLIALFKKK